MFNQYYIHDIVQVILGSHFAHLEHFVNHGNIRMLLGPLFELFLVNHGNTKIIPVFVFLFYNIPWLNLPFFVKDKII
jgi:hypothetical protein